eukprot:1916277-Rhodomonas_salina.2
MPSTGLGYWATVSGTEQGYGATEQAKLLEHLEPSGHEFSLPVSGTAIAYAAAVPGTEIAYA